MSTWTDALHSAAMIGPYFELEIQPGGNGWRPLSDLTDDPLLLRERVERTRRALVGDFHDDAVAHRVAASIDFLGTAARLVSAPLAMAASAGVVPQLSATTVLWREGGSPMPLALIDPPVTVAATTDELAALLFDQVITSCITPLATTIERDFRLSPQVIWGNVASALAGAAAMITTADPIAAGRAWKIVDRSLGIGRLAGTGQLTNNAAGLRPTFRRNNCCLYYRLPGGGMCGDCVLQQTCRQPRSAANTPLR